jgi:hypothetical protein
MLCRVYAGGCRTTRTALWHIAIGEARCPADVFAKAGVMKTTGQSSCPNFYIPSNRLLVSGYHNFLARISTSQAIVSWFPVVTTFSLLRSINRDRRAPPERMPEPLSITASVAGLLGTSVKVLITLHDLYQNAKDAPESISRVIDEVQGMNLLFGQVQVFISGRAKADHDRLKKIPVNHLVTTLTGCVVVYSNLDRMIEDVAGLSAGSGVAMKKGKRVWERVKWAAWKESEIASLLEELQRHKSSLNLMLSIIQW